MKNLKLITLIASSFVFVGCTTTPEQCDPSIELDVFDKAACQLSGSYQKRVEQKEIALQKEQNVNDQLNESYSTIKNKKEKTKKQVTQKSTQLNTLNKSANEQKAKLTKGQKNLDVLKQEIKQIEDKIASVKSNGALSATQKEKELQRLQSVLSAREAEAAAIANF